VDGKVIGVVKDFPYASVRDAITPMVLSGRYQHSETMNIRLAGDNYAEAIASLEKSWKKMYPANPFKYWFMDQEFGRLYKQEMQMGKLADYFTGFTIVIACLGLFGLASFTAEQKTKEIGIRKVLGASIGQILVLLTNKFIRLVLISYVIAIPLALYAMNSWLENFAYKVPLHWSAFVGAGLLILVLTYITVGIESIRRRWRIRWIRSGMSEVTDHGKGNDVVSSSRTKVNSIIISRDQFERAFTMFYQTASSITSTTNEHYTFYSNACFSAFLVACQNVTCSF